MAIVRVSVLVDVKQNVDDVEDLRNQLLNVVVKKAKTNPKSFLLKELNIDDENDWYEIEEHDSDAEV